MKTLLVLLCCAICFAAGLVFAAQGAPVNVSSLLKTKPQEVQAKLTEKAWQETKQRYRDMCSQHYLEQTKCFQVHPQDYCTAQIRKSCGE